MSSQGTLLAPQQVHTAGWGPDGGLVEVGPCISRAWQLSCPQDSGAWAEAC